MDSLVGPQVKICKVTEAFKGQHVRLHLLVSCSGAGPHHGLLNVTMDLQVTVNDSWRLHGPATCTCGGSFRYPAQVQGSEPCL